MSKLILALIIIIIFAMAVLVARYNPPIENTVTTNVSEIKAYISPEGKNDKPAKQTIVGNSFVSVTTTQYASGASITEYDDPYGIVVEETDASGKMRTIIATSAPGV